MAVMKNDQVTSSSTPQNRYFPPVLDDDESITVTMYHLPEQLKLRNALRCDPSKRDVVVQEWLTYTSERNKHAEKCHVWKMIADEAERERVESVRLERYKKIQDRLVALGYNSELLNLGIKLQGLSASVYAFFKRPRPLSDDEWMEYLPELRRFLDSRRTLECRRSQVSAMSARLGMIDTTLDVRRKELALDQDILWPSAIDLVELPVVAHLVQLHDAVIIPAISYSAMVDAYVHEWREARETALVTLLLGKPPSCPPSHASPLASPTALFWCTHCKQLVHGIVAMTHSCCYGFDPDWANLHQECSPWIDGAYSQLIADGGPLFRRTCIVYSQGVMPWSPLPLRPCGDLVRTVIEALGTDLSAFDTRDTKLDDIRLACCECSQMNRVMVVMGWRRAVQHMAEAHNHDQVDWMKVRPEVVRKVKEMEDDEQEGSAHVMGTRARWTCVRCWWPQCRIAYTFDQLREHFIESHPLVVLHSKWYRRSCDSPESMHPPVIIHEEGLGDDHASVDDVVWELASTLVDARVTPMQFPKDAWSTWSDRR
ncbi:hypothetical protein C8Q76DRAFT_788962 [Earliella scabrosa]|nr:hypothetical protein C8Q76DRAFT_788962 [Earliella scabrosa]